MKNVKTFSEFVNESEEFESINESLFAYTDTAVKVVKDLMKKYESLPMNAENFDKIKKALPKDSTEYGVHGRVRKATKYTKYLEDEFEGRTSIFKGYRYLFDKSGKLKFIVNAIGGAGQDIGEIILIDGYKGSPETWAYENYPKIFKPKTWEVYRYSDVNRGFGNAGTVEFVEAPTVEIAKQRVKAPGADKYDPFWIEHGIQEIDKKEVTKKKQEIRKMADHYAKLAKQMGV